MFTTYLRRALKQFYQDKAPLLAAGITFYIALALAPLLVVIIYVFAVFLGTDLAETYALQVIGQFLPTGAGAVWQNAQTSFLPMQGNVTAVVVSIIIAVFTVSGAVLAVQDALHTVWGIKKSGSLRYAFSRRVFSILFIVLIGVLLLASVVLSLVISIVTLWVQTIWSLPAPLLHSVNTLLFLVLLSVLFYYVQITLSQVKVPRRAVLLSCIVTAVLFLLGQIALTYYITVAMGSASGIVGTVFVLLLWIYYLVQVCLFGIELTKAYVLVHNLPIEPVKGYALAS